ncbi:hypothetical protein RFM68_23265 [Mesorhizobium sp. MSK_1335]|uniref:Uncharacterized protein n=1 Tax=Mesorhizobium montanum TaxID=3072323 RepID=A0ABU4ZQZ7_9HYPH|nr:hypothetical protein [Mesorhizobium sp. MSK_1335]MDX8527425.1 hypothetical protein [Mesorhizobium sp. MSK_1335]
MHFSIEGAWHSRPAPLKRQPSTTDCRKAERLVLYSGSHSGDVIEEPSFGELERELKLIESSPDAYVLEFADGLSELIRMARREKNPIVFV